MRRLLSPPLLKLFLPLALAVVAIGAAIYTYERQIIQRDLAASEMAHVATARQLTAHRMKDVIRDVRFLASLPHMRLAVGGGSSADIERLEDLLRAFSEQKAVFDQVRYIDETGHERVRVDLLDGHAQPVAQDRLANKANRYYVSAAMRLQPGQVFVSRFDLNVERGVVEKPYKPVIRLASRVNDMTGRPRGVVVVNLLGELIRDMIRSATGAARGVTLLLNDDGYWLMSDRSEQEWGFMFPDGTRFSDSYPVAWERLGNGLRQFRSEGGLFTQAILSPQDYLGATGLPQDATGAVGNWHIVTRIGDDNLAALLEPVRKRVAGGVLLGLLLSFAGSAGYLRSQARNETLSKENRRFSRSITEKQRLLDLFITHVPAAVAMLDTDMRYLAFSRRWLEDFGLPGDIAHKRHFDVLPDAPAHWKRIYQRCLEGEACRRDEERFLRADGTEHWLRWEARPWYDASEEIGGIILLTEDITTRKRAEASRDEFVAKVSHELRTPLTAIGGALGLLGGRLSATPDHKARTLVELADRNTARLLHLVNDLLDMQKLKLGRMQFEVNDVAMGDVAQAAIESMRPIAEQAGVELHLDGNARSALVSCDAARVGQVITNFLSNALRFSPSGSRVIVSVDREQGEIVLTVSDCGPGVPADFREALFDDFAQADRGDTRNPGGSGLGLSISRAIIEQQGAVIGYADGRSGGATFFFRFPEKVVRRDPAPVC